MININPIMAYSRGIKNSNNDNRPKNVCFGALKANAPVAKTANEVLSEMYKLFRNGDLSFTQEKGKLFGLIVKNKQTAESAVDCYHEKFCANEIKDQVKKIGNEEYVYLYSDTSGVDVALRLCTAGKEAGDVLHIVSNNIKNTIKSNNPIIDSVYRNLPYFSRHSKNF